MWLVPFFAKNVLASTLNICVSVAVYITPAVASVKIIVLLIQKKLLPSYPAVVNYFPKKFANDQAIVEMNLKILRYI